MFSTRAELEQALDLINDAERLSLQDLIKLIEECKRIADEMSQGKNTKVNGPWLDLLAKKIDDVRIQQLIEAKSNIIFNLCSYNSRILTIIPAEMIMSYIRDFDAAALSSVTDFFDWYCAFKDYPQDNPDSLNIALCAIKKSIDIVLFAPLYSKNDTVNQCLQFLNGYIDSIIKGQDASSGFAVKLQEVAREYLHLQQ